MANKNKEQEKSINLKTKTSNGLKELVKKLVAPIKSMAWLVEVGVRLLASYLILTNFTHVLAVIVGMYLAGSAILIIVSFFFKANK